jgi:pyruvate dehydrogenase E1 component beta subunit
MEAAEILAKEGIDAEVIDLRTLYPLDKDIIRESVSKTHRVIVLTEENKRGGYGGEISAMIAEELFDELDAPIARIGALNTPVPFAYQLEQYYLPNAQDVVKAAKGLL